MILVLVLILIDLVSAVRNVDVTPVIHYVAVAGEGGVGGRHSIDISNEIRTLQKMVDWLSL